MLSNLVFWFRSTSQVPEVGDHSRWELGERSSFISDVHCQVSRGSSDTMKFLCLTVPLTILNWAGPDAGQTCWIAHCSAVVFWARSKEKRLKVPATDSFFHLAPRFSASSSGPGPSADPVARRSVDVCVSQPLQFTQSPGANRTQLRNSHHQLYECFVFLCS